MYKVMPTLPMTEVRNSISSIVADLGQSPVVLTQNGREAAVIVHPDMWNKLIETYEQWAKMQPVTDPRFLTWVQFEQQLIEAGIPLDLAQKTLQKGLEKLAKMESDPTSIVSSTEMRKRMAERNVYVGS
jgi:prevent-host-death family protein